MILNEIQISILSQINQPLNSDKRIKDLNTFFELRCEVKEENHSCPWVIEKVKNTISQNIYRIKTENVETELTLKNGTIIFKDRDKTFFETIYFLELVDYLEKNKLITFVEKDPDDLEKFKIPVLEGNILNVFGIDPIDDRIWQLIKEFVLVEIFPLPDLNEFIQHGYKTDNEFKNEEEIKDRKHELSITRKSLIITIFALIISVAVNIYSIYMNTTDRNISIVKDLTKKDTNKILITNNPLVYDTIKVYDTVKVK
jgi:hypothetical protein